MLKICIVFSECFIIIIIQKYLYCECIICESPYLKIPLILQLRARLTCHNTEYTLRNSFIHLTIFYYPIPKILHDYVRLGALNQLHVVGQ